MSQNFHRFSELFAQLGLPNRESDIRGFIIIHSPLPHAVALHDAPFWTPSQSAFLREEWLKDADWAEIIDQLNSALRSA
ncbi:DUF2789 domain-containing protein [Methylobacillus sp.]|uniref:DUF2789 domain-containing protein n=1 Tax=Methylobacillus sp. TaxID=56818 RepID=UPI002FDFBEEF